MEAEHKKEYRQRILPAVVLLLVFVLPLFLFTGCTAKNEQTMNAVHVVRLATDYREEDLGYQQLQIFAQGVSEKSKGALEVQIYKAGEWSNAESFLEYINSGVLDMACLPGEQAVILQPGYAVYEQPYLFSGLSMVEQYVCGTVAHKALQQLPQEYYGIGFVADGYRYWVQQSSDKMYSYGMVKHLAEIHELENTIIYDVQAVYGLHPLVVSQKWWADLAEQEQLWLQESFQESLKSILIHQKEIAPQRLEDSGAVVGRMIPAELSGITMQWLNQRELYFLSHSDVLTAYWRPTVVTVMNGEEE